MKRYGERALSPSKTDTECIQLLQYGWPIRNVAAYANRSVTHIRQLAADLKISQYTASAEGRVSDRFDASCSINLMQAE